MSGPYPFRLRVQRAITQALAEISPDDGYQFDLRPVDDHGDGVLTPRVFRGRTWFGETDPIPMVSILDDTAPADEIGNTPRRQTVTEEDWSLLIQGFVIDDPENPTDPAYRLAADVQQRLAQEITRRTSDGQTPDPFGMGTGKPNRVLGLRIGAPVARPADDVSAKAYFWMRLTLRITEDTSKPYA